MYADYSRDQVNAFLRDITDCPNDAGTMEDTLDAEMALLMEQVRCRNAFRRGQEFTARNNAFGSRPNIARLHPADCV